MNHRKLIPAVTRLPHHNFKPKHCAGATCVHDHHVDQRPPIGWFKPFRAILDKAAA